MEGASRAWLVTGGVLGLLALLIGVLWAIGSLPRLAPETEAVDVTGAGVGAPVATYLSDGMPVWVVLHDDGEYELLTGFDAHHPDGIRQLLWWCPSSSSFENPDTGAKYDEYGVKYDGPAPGGLVSWPLTVTGTTAEVGEAQPTPAIGTPYLGPPSNERQHCFGEDALTLHRFEGFPAWDSPQALLEAGPAGWALVAAELVEGTDGPMLCSLAGCNDAAPTRGIEMPPSEFVAMQPPQLQWLVRVDGGALADLTRVIDPAGWTRNR